MQIVKGNGTREEFDQKKLERSMLRSGADPNIVKRLAERVTAHVREGMTTSEIYRYAFKELKKKERPLAARYSMRRAILDMGPTGFPFEDFFSKIMEAHGYQALVRQELNGRCAEHEVDAVLEKDGIKVGAELKFHNAVGFKTDLKTALYVRARFWDIERAAEDRDEVCDIKEAWLVTNTKFTSRAIRYGECSGLKLLGWNYPREKNLADLIHEASLYPVTVLTGLSKKEESRLLAAGATLCRDITKDPEVLVRAGIPKRKHAAVVSESTALCRG